jgi:LmbE family N-acetylglucosaminyl deacetylase
MPNLRHPNAEFFVPDGTDADAALARTTHMAVVAHPDDCEIMAISGILECFQQDDKWFTSIVVTDGKGSPRLGVYERYTDDEMVAVRRQETKKAAVLGGYSATGLLQWSSKVTKDPVAREVIDDLKDLVLAAKPEVMYCHNLADKHDTHVASALRLIAALRELPAEDRPKTLYGGEVWRDLDWLTDNEKIVFKLTEHDGLAQALLAVFDSQVVGGKRYDLATMGRRRANATYWESHGVDVADYLDFSMDLTPLIADPSLDIKDYLQDRINRFAADVAERLGKLLA